MWACQYVGSGSNMEEFDSMNGREGELMVMCRQPLQTELFKIPNLDIRPNNQRDTKVENAPQEGTV